MVEQLVAALGLDVDVAFCPERIAEGKAMNELARAAADRRRVAPRRARRGPTQAVRATSPTTIVELEPEEAELAKLFTNTWRYIKFATANQLYMMANDFGLDYERIRAGAHATTTRAPPTCPVPGSPPALPAQGHDAAGRVQQQQLPARPRGVLVNEGLPLYLVARLEQRYDLSKMTRRHPRHGVQGASPTTSARA